MVAAMKPAHPRTARLAAKNGESEAFSNQHTSSRDKSRYSQGFTFVSRRAANPQNVYLRESSKGECKRDDALQWKYETGA